MRVDGNSGNGILMSQIIVVVFQRKSNLDFKEPPLSVKSAADHWNHREGMKIISSNLITV